MTREEKALIYFKDLRERKVKDYSSVFDTAPKGTVVYEAVSAEIEIYDTAIKALEQDSILNKVRAKIEVYKLATDHAISEDELKIEGMKEAYINCLEIIDRLIAESEEYNEKRNKLPQGFDYALCWVESEEV